MRVYEICKEHDGWCETELVQTLEEAQKICKDYYDTAPYEAHYKEYNLVEWLMEVLDSQVMQLDGDWLLDNLKNVLGN